jgi:uncharacterized YccA/Bax inhibitor family protein
MAIFNSSNPTLNESIFQKSLPIDQTEVMTERGTLNKFGFLFVLVLASASFTWSAFYQGKNVLPWVIGAAIIGFILALVTSFVPKYAPYTSPPYALVQGVFLGGISSVFNYAFAEKAPGIVMQAVALTFGVVIAMFLLYRFRIIKVTEQFKMGVVMATLGIGLFYLIAIVLQMFGIPMVLIHEGTTLGIVFSLFVVAIAALNLILNFDMIEKGVAMGAPKYMEWYGAFGLLVTIIWLYLEMLRLLSKFAGRK